MEERHAELGRLQAHWLEAGEGAPVVFLPGGPGSARLWRHVVPLLPGVRALCVEHAGEEREPGVAALADWLDGIDVGRAVLVGHGRGCSLVQELAAARRELVGGIVLTGSGPRRLRDRVRPDERLADLGVPATVVWGEHDDLRLGRALADALGADFDLVEDGGRRLPEGHPGRVAQAIGRVAATQTATAAAARLAPLRARSSASSAPRTRRALRPG